MPTRALAVQRVPASLHPALLSLAPQHFLDLPAISPIRLENMPEPPAR